MAFLSRNLKVNKGKSVGKVRPFSCSAGLLLICLE